MEQPDLHQPNRPIFVAIEGLDGSGKSTLARRLALHLNADPLTTPMSTLPSEARQAAESMCGDDPLARMLFYASTVAAASQHIRTILARGRSVIVDRYWLSTLTYHRVLGAPAWLSEVETSLVPADLTFFLDVSTEVRHARLTARGALQAHDRMTLRPGVGDHITALYRQFGAELAVAGRFQAIKADALSVDELVEFVSDEVRRAGNPRST